jgi:hypothetical protein
MEAGAQREAVGVPRAGQQPWWWAGRGGGVGARRVDQLMRGEGVRCWEGCFCRRGCISMACSACIHWCKRGSDPRRPPTPPRRLRCGAGSMALRAGMVVRCVGARRWTALEGGLWSNAFLKRQICGRPRFFVLASFTLPARVALSSISKPVCYKAAQDPAVAAELLLQGRGLTPRATLGAPLTASHTSLASLLGAAPLKNVAARLEGGGSRRQRRRGRARQRQARQGGGRVAGAGHLGALGAAARALASFIRRGALRHSAQQGGKPGKLCARRSETSPQLRWPASLSAPARVRAAPTAGSCGQRCHIFISMTRSRT